MAERERERGDFPIFPERAVKLGGQIAARESVANARNSCPLRAVSDVCRTSFSFEPRFLRHPRARLEVFDGDYARDEFIDVEIVLMNLAGLIVASANFDLKYIAYPDIDE